MCFTNKKGSPEIYLIGVGLGLNPDSYQKVILPVNCRYNPSICMVAINQVQTKMVYQNQTCAILQSIDYAQEKQRL